MVTFRCAGIARPVGVCTLAAICSLAIVAETRAHAAVATVAVDAGVAADAEVGAAASTASVAASVTATSALAAQVPADAAVFDATVGEAPTCAVWLSGAWCFCFHVREEQVTTRQIHITWMGALWCGQHTIHCGTASYLVGCARGARILRAETPNTPDNLPSGDRVDLEARN